MRKFNSVFALAAGVALSFGLAQMPVMAATADTTATTTAGTHHQDHVWRVGCDAAFAPFTYTDEKGQLIGFDVDLIKAIGAEMGYTIDMKGYPFDGIIPTLITNNIDMIISGFTISPERAERVDFSDPYYRCGLTFLTLKKNADKFSTFDDIAKAKICVQIGTTGALFLQKTLKNPDMRQFNTPPETYLELQNGGCEVVVNDRPVNDFFLAQSPENKKNVVSKDIDIAQNEYYGIAIAKGNTELLKLVNEGLKRVIDNGKFAEISNKWFGYDITDDLKAHSAEAAAALAGVGSGK
ncbi:MAG: basic amino acid ABC transporter substrate-binding protein [Candidatus Anaerobiospirillum pullicola]|uniref:Basic amino acid ABC transporter substrate-binding protein n=1 Tax=Candidatus Anaerobiospirillum pullicola TaxID=2838451 RepID=A0A948WWZ0_9GAMM|nr:basic amino acid ABC transporter substrate-binding protein [Candidatus Anaerobiospirillum pullicola]